MQQSPHVRLPASAIPLVVLSPRLGLPGIGFTGVERARVGLVGHFQQSVGLPRAMFGRQRIGQGTSHVGAQILG